MVTDTRLRLAVFLVALGATLLVASDIDPAGGSIAHRGIGQPAKRVASTAAQSFPCPWHWNLYDGLRPGYVTARSNADCTGRQGSLTLSIRLQGRKRTDKRWHTDKVRTRTWRNLQGNHALTVAQRCAFETVRAVMRWTLRDTRGAVVARHVVRSGSLAVPGPGCRTVLR
jgi:hypothetical protein